MKLQSAFIIAFICGCISTSAYAKESSFPLLADCLQQCDQAFVSLIACYQEEYDRQDARLNDAYKKLVNEADPELKVSLTKSQQAWVSFKEEYSSFLYGGSGTGQIQRLNSMYWLVTATADRASDLENSE